MIKSESPPKNMFSKPEVEENFLNLIKGTYLKKKNKKKKKPSKMLQFTSVQALSPVRLFATP